MEIGLSDFIPDAPDEWFRARIKNDKGIFDRNSFESSMRSCKKAGLAIDVGAHVGTWTIGLAERFRYVFAFEPHPNNFTYLVNNISGANIGNALPLRFAVGDEWRRCGISSYQENSGTSHVIDGNDVPMLRLDDIATNADFIKIDVEGFECAVLRGAETLIRRSRPVMCIEFTGHGERYGYDEGKIREYVRSFGYTLAEVVNKDHIYIPQNA